MRTEELPHLLVMALLIIPLADYHSSLSIFALAASWLALWIGLVQAQLVAVFHAHLVSLFAFH